MPAPRQGPLRFDHCVDRRMVHRASISEVFVTDSAVVADGRFLVAGQLPRGHSMIESASYDMNILVEFLRQASVYVTHRYLDVPTDDARFVFRDLSLQLTPSAMRVGSAPGKASADLAVQPRRTAGGRITGVTLEVELRIDEHCVLRGTGSLMVMTEGGWDAVRRRGRAQALNRTQPLGVRQVAAPPALVGRTNPRNVVVSSPTFVQDGVSVSWLVVDLTHPYMFDHQLDHLPGNLILEGARQAAVGSVALSHGIDPLALAIHGCRGDFTNFGELDLATRLTTRTAELRYDAATGSTVCPATVVVEQGGTPAATVELTIGASS